MGVPNEATELSGTASASVQTSIDFTRFSRSEYASLVGMLSVLLGDRWLAQDLAQEALARAWTKWSRVGSLERPDLWTKHVAVNLARSLWRRRQVATRFARLAHDPGEPAGTGAYQSLHQAVAQLPSRQRLAIALRYFDDLTVAEAARTMACKEGTVRALTSQAIATLRTAGVINQEVNDD